MLLAGPVNFKGVHHVALICSNLERSLEFYQNILGECGVDWGTSMKQWSANQLYGTPACTTPQALVQQKAHPRHSSNQCQQPAVHTLCWPFTCSSCACHHIKAAACQFSASCSLVHPTGHPVLLQGKGICSTPSNP
jgi:hypothetical protein